MIGPGLRWIIIQNNEGVKNCDREWSSQDGLPTASKSGASFEKKKKSPA